MLYDNAVAITPSDSTVLSPPIDAIHVGVAGNIAVRTAAGAEVTLVGCLAGTIYPIKVDMVKSTSTTATTMVGLRLGGQGTP